MKIFFILFFCIFLLTGCGYDKTNSDNYINYNTESLSIQENSQNVESLNSSIVDTPIVPKEEPLSSFSTKISQKDPDRQTNITLACNSLNGIVVKSGETFSFCETLGPAKPEDGYKKADTFDSDGNTIQAYGGGKCQVSTTLYNAVLSGYGLTVVERYEHSGPVYYVPEGQDACVAYGSCDFKFRNDNEFDIKMYFSNTPDAIDVSINKISS